LFREGQVIPSFSIITVQKAGLKDLSDEKSFQLDEKTNILRTIDFTKRWNLSLLPGNQCPIIGFRLNRLPLFVDFVVNRIGNRTCCW
jgi:hypothetical protein